LAISLQESTPCFRAAERFVFRPIAISQAVMVCVV
jgi:hypothetical protein